MTRWQMVGEILLLASGVEGWGVDGHSIVAEIAERLLSEATKTRALDIVGGASLASIADWADEYRHSPGGQWSGSLHYADLPERVCEFEPTRDCVDSHCVYGAIMNYTQRVQQLHGDMDLKFLVHLVGDAHQPLHAGFTSDRGGNEIHVTADFHKKLVWDEAILSQSEEEVLDQADSRPGHHAWMKKADSLFKRIDEKIVKDERERCDCPFECALVILKESARLACDMSYKSGKDGHWIKSGDKLERDYFESRAAIVDSQLIKAGVRLAILIEAALAQPAAQESEDILVFDA